jgi:phage terminase small subunit
MKIRSKITNLTRQQELFCQEYILNGFNGVKAYEVAYSNNGLYNTKNTAQYRLLREPVISKRINELLKELKDISKEQFKDSCYLAIKRIENLRDIALNRKKRVKVLERVNEETDLFGNNIYIEKETVTFEDDPDFMVVLKCEEMIGRLTGDIKDIININQNNINITFDCDAEDKKLINVNNNLDDIVELSEEEKEENKLKDIIKIINSKLEKDDLITNEEDL